MLDLYRQTLFTATLLTASNSDGKVEFLRQSFGIWIGDACIDILVGDPSWKVGDACILIGDSSWKVGDACILVGDQVGKLGMHVFWLGIKLESWGCTELQSTSWDIFIWSVWNAWLSGSATASWSSLFKLRVSLLARSVCGSLLDTYPQEDDPKRGCP
jgi:hypothetical protein